MNYEIQATNRLPDSAKARFVRLVQDKDDAHAILSPLVDREMSIRATKNENERQLLRLTQSSVVKSNPSAYAHTKMTLETAIEAGLAELKNVKELSEARRHRWQVRGNLVGAIVNYITSIPTEVNITISNYAGDKSGARIDVTKEVERCRQRILDLNAEIAAVNAAPISSAVAKQLARKQIDALAERGRPNVFGLLESGDVIHWPLIQAYGAESSAAIMADLVRGNAVPIAAPGTGSPDTLAFYAWHNRDGLISSINRLIDECADDKQALSDDERAKRRLNALEAMLKTERDEEFLIRSGQANGLDLNRRWDADPRAVLGLADSLPAPRSSF